MDEFEEFWKLYPRKAAKADARKAWKQVEKIRPPIADLMKSLHAARASKQWQKDEGEFIPYPASFLRGERWSDEYEVDLANLSSGKSKVCRYCSALSVGSVDGRYHCRDHGDLAMDGVASNVVSIKA